MLPTFYISDCSDDNVRARYAARIAATVPQAGTVTFIGVKNDLEAAGNLVDVLDGLEGKASLIFVNVAPRGTIKTLWPNGTPFGYLKFNNAHIFTTLDGCALSLLKKISSVPLSVTMYDIPTVVTYLTDNLPLQKYITESQFRSFDFLPRIAGLILAGNTVPTMPWETIPNIPECIWWVDNFGNAKTTLLESDFMATAGKPVSVNINDIHHSLNYYSRLKDIPHGELGIYVGSSGFKEKRFLEITKQKGESLHKDTTPALSLSSGQAVTITGSSSLL